MDIKDLVLKKLQDDPEQAERLRTLIEEKKRRENENLCQKYIPNMKCEEFIKKVGRKGSFINLFSAANGVGKTTVMCNIIANICFGTQNEYFNCSLYKNFPYLKKGRIISDPTTLKEKIVPELKKWFPSNRFDVKYETSKDGKNYESKWRTDTGFEFDLMSNEQDAKEFESVDLGWIAFDEPSKKDIYLASIARLRRGGVVLWTMTPLSYSAWIKDEIYNKADGELITVTTADVWSNCKDIEGTRGILSKENIDKMIAQYPDYEREARIEGKFGHLLGRVHDTFDRQIHVIKPFPINYRDYTVYCALDTHPRVNDAYTLLAVDKNGQKYVIGELWYKGLSHEVAEVIRAKETGLRVVKRLIDPSSMNDDQRTDDIPFGVKLANMGLQFELGSKDLLGGIRRTNEALAYEKRGEEFIRKPELFVFNTCEHTIREFEEYVWDEYRGRGSDEKDPKPRPKDKDDHFMENLHRLLIIDPEFVDYHDENYYKQDKDFDPYDII